MPHVGLVCRLGGVSAAREYFCTRGGGRGRPLGAEWPLKKEITGPAPKPGRRKPQARAHKIVPQAQPAVRRRRPKSEVGPRRQAERGPGAGPPQAPHPRDRWTPTPLFQGGLVDKNRLSALGAGPLLAPAGATNERAPPCSPSPTSPHAKSPRPSLRLRLLPSMLMTTSPSFPTLRRGIWWQGFYKTQFRRL